MGTMHGDAPPIFVHDRALEQILCYSEQDLNRETGGFLVGGWHDDQGPYVEVRQFLPALDARSQAGALTFTHAAWSAMTREVERRFPGEILVGWHHTHPNFGVFLSAHDLFIQRNFFRETWQIALVVDPRRRQFGFFQWRGGQVVDCGFICVSASQRKTT